MRSFTSEIMRYRQVSPTVNAAVESLFDVGRALRDRVAHPLLDAVAPAFTYTFESALDSINAVLEALDQTGITLQDVAKTALATGGIVGNAFRVMASGVESSLALLQEMTALTRQGRVDARQRGAEAADRWQKSLEAIGRIMSGDLSGIMPKQIKRQFIASDRQPPSMGRGRDADLSMPALERSTNEAMLKIMGIQRPGKLEDQMDAALGHLGAIDRNTQPRRGGDTLEVARLGGR